MKVENKEGKKRMKLLIQSDKLTTLPLILWFMVALCREKERMVLLFTCCSLFIPGKEQ